MLEDPARQDAGGLPSCCWSKNWMRYSKEKGSRLVCGLDNTEDLGG